MRFWVLLLVAIAAPVVLLSLLLVVYQRFRFEMLEGNITWVVSIIVGLVIFHFAVRSIPLTTRLVLYAVYAVPMSFGAVWYEYFFVCKFFGECM